MLFRSVSACIACYALRRIAPPKNSSLLYANATIACAFLFGLTILALLGASWSEAISDAAAFIAIIAVCKNLYNKEEDKPFSYKWVIFGLICSVAIFITFYCIQNPAQYNNEESQASSNTSSSVNSKISISRFPEKVKPGEKAKVSIIGQPYTEYDITVIYSSGPSQSKDLHSKKSDKNGSVSWEWKVGSQTKPGKYKVLISGNGDTLELTLNVT